MILACFRGERADEQPTAIGQGWWGESESQQKEGTDASDGEGGGLATSTRAAKSRLTQKMGLLGVAALGLGNRLGTVR